ncbi:hypothetical protein ABEF92_008124 [Exophiala dermatitidis]|uniref:Protein phosphatase n=1 Tax=Exophiala dermatitidis (strain ATCC 34100 / CBS 525.76 / NIH/UT8656) TaxID=858893 RepID=H6BS12_EXODN|nr:uncharacterized protein HMPREF1120_02244 [Exophiala dermatitidis NIH/UT8656]EHY54067.1 hypothetical protein HMPREF1120_02244 [Exophiala dermatitidis NIH/UT8656]
MLTHVARSSRHAIVVAGAAVTRQTALLRPAIVSFLRIGGLDLSTGHRRCRLSSSCASAAGAKGMVVVALSTPKGTHFSHRIHSPHRHHYQQLGSRWSSPSSLQYTRTLSVSTPLHRRYLISEGRTTTPESSGEVEDEHEPASLRSCPFYLETGYSIFAKRASRPFPPPFVSLPSGSFSDPLTTHNVSRGRRPYVNGQPVRGITNGDDAIIIADKNFIAVNDGVGAWALKDRGHAALWSRLIAHFWALEVEKSFEKGGDVALEDLNPIQNLQDAYSQTKAALKGGLLKEDGQEARQQNNNNDEKQSDGDANKSTTVHQSSSSSSSSNKSDKSDKKSAKDKESDANDILGTTTASSALLHYRRGSSSGGGSNASDAQQRDSKPIPVILATTLGDCKVLVVRPSTNKVLYHSKEQWHWFDCPRQLGTNSPDTPLKNAVTDTVDIEVGDVVLVLSDGVTDNLWEHEICQNVTTSVSKWIEGEDQEAVKDGPVYVARSLMNAAREIAQDPNAESPYMERAFDEGIAAEGGKLDDISVVVGVCRQKEGNGNGNSAKLDKS